MENVDITFLYYELNFIWDEENYELNQIDVKIDWAGQIHLRKKKQFVRANIITFTRWQCLATKKKKTNKKEEAEEYIRLQALVSAQERRISPSWPVLAPTVVSFKKDSLHF